MGLVGCWLGKSDLLNVLPYKTMTAQCYEQMTKLLRKGDILIFFHFFEKFCGTYEALGYGAVTN